jgi:hypothetical protein
MPWDASSYSAGERVGLATLPDGVLERIYGFCPGHVVAHLAVCKRFLQHLPYADQVWLRPKLDAARRLFEAPASLSAPSAMEGGAHSGAAEPHGGGPPTPLCQPHWSAPPPETYAERCVRQARKEIVKYGHKDYPELQRAGAVSREDDRQLRPLTSSTLAKFKGRVQLHLEDERSSLLLPVHAAVFACGWTNLDTLNVSSADLGCQHPASPASASRPANALLLSLCDVLMRLPTLRRLMVQECRLHAPGLVALVLALVGGQTGGGAAGPQPIDVGVEHHGHASLVALTFSPADQVNPKPLNPKP